MKKLVIVLGLITVFALLVACAPAPAPTPVPPAPTSAPQVTALPPTVPPTAVPATKAPEPTKAPAATTAPTQPPPTTAPTAVPTPAAKGANVDEVVFFEEADSAKGVSITEAGDMNIYGYTISDPKLFAKVKESKALAYDQSYGSTSELTLNPSGPTFKDGRLNPFSVAAIREATNWLVDRNYIAKEIYGGLAVPMWIGINPVFPDYAQIADTARALELKYAYDVKKAKEVIDAEMKKLGAELTGGKWTFKGAPVTLIFLIRTEDERRAIGDYLGKQFEDLGFTVDRQYKTAAEASPLWLRADPADGKMHMYTGGWISTVVNRDWGPNFDFYYTSRGRTDTLWQAYKPAAEFDQLSEKLGRGNYKDTAERLQLMAKVAELSMKDSVRIWVVNRISFTPRRNDFVAASDLAGGITGSFIWAYTAQFTGKTGGQVKWGSPSILTQPWNYIAGTNWIYDTTIIRGTRDIGLLPDPYTGLYWPQRVETAEVTVAQGNPVGKTLDWVTVKTAASIEVPKDAWADWDAEKQAFITAGERFTQTQTAKTKTVINFDKNLYKTKWHDGSTFSYADALLSFILTFDLAKEKSPNYDESQVPAFKTFMTTFKGLKVVSKDPLVVEVYGDRIFLDAEAIVNNWYPLIFPIYFNGVGPWHAIGLSLQADAAKEVAMSSAKSDKLKVEWANYIAGPTLKTFEKYATKSLTLINN